MKCPGGRASCVGDGWQGVSLMLHGIGGLQVGGFLQELVSLTRAHWKSLGGVITNCQAAATLALIRRPKAGPLPKSKEGTWRHSNSQSRLQNLRGPRGRAVGGGEGTVVLSDRKQGLCPETLV